MVLSFKSYRFSRPWWDNWCRIMQQVPQAIKKMAKKSGGEIMIVEITFKNDETKEYEIDDKSLMPAKDLVMAMLEDGYKAEDLKSMRYLEKQSPKEDSTEE